jgi:hypothetical protein
MGSTGAVLDDKGGTQIGAAANADSAGEVLRALPTVGSVAVHKMAAPFSLVRMVRQRVLKAIFQYTLLMQWRCLNGAPWS